MVILQFEGHSFIPISKNTQTEFLIHQFCGEALKPHPNTGKSLLIQFNYFFKMFFSLVAINLTSNCKVSMHNCSKRLNLSFIKITVFHEKSFPSTISEHVSRVPSAFEVQFTERFLRLTIL